MPGIFGTAGRDSGAFDSLVRDFRDAWGPIETVRRGQIRLGGHAFGDRSAVAARPDAPSLAVDGEFSLYVALEKLGRRPSGEGNEGFELSTDSVGNIASVSKDDHALHIATDPSGMFPLYFAHRPNCLLFSSHLRPLSRAVGNVTLDPIGTTVYLHGAYFVGDHTFFQEIRRLLPGQGLVYGVDADALFVHERSRAWATAGEGRSQHRPLADVADEAWKLLGSATRDGLEGSFRPAIFLSAGWDSRTLAALIRHDGIDSDPVGLTHGDLESREVRLAGRIRGIADLPGQSRALEPEDFRLEFLRSVFTRAESAQFPYWARSAETAKSLGADVVTAGIFGEVLGGHYGLLPHQNGMARAASLLGLALPLAGFRDHVSPSREQIVGSFKKMLTERSSYLNRAFWSSGSSIDRSIGKAVEREFQRLSDRGVQSPTRLVEAFTTEHRGAQYIGAQLRTSRCVTEVSAPFGRTAALEFAAGLPFGAKVHNRLNQLILRRHAHEFLEPPLAATLVSASAPLLLQETSRVIRKMRQFADWRLHRLSGRRISPPRFGWINFEFLRDAPHLERIAGQLTHDIWDQNEIGRLLRSVRENEWEGSLHPVVHQMLKMLTVEWMLR